MDASTARAAARTSRVRFTCGRPEVRGRARGRISSGSQGELLDEPVDGLPQRRIFAQKGLDLADRVQDRCVILTAEGAADLGKRGVSELPRKIHGDLTRKGHGFRPLLGLQLGELDPEAL